MSFFFVTAVLFAVTLSIRCPMPMSKGSGSSTLVIERTFTTEPKNPSRRHGNKTIRRNCIEFVSWLKLNGYEQLPLEHAKRLYQHYFGPKDRATLKGYFGSRKGKSTRLIRRVAKYPSGTISYKSIQLEQEIFEKEGYLEFLNLVHYECRGPTWFLVLNNEVVVIPEIAKSPTSNEAVVGSIPNLSLSPYTTIQPSQVNHGDIRIDDMRIDDVDTKYNNNYRMRERKNIGVSIPTQESESNLSSLEEAILNAKPCENQKEPDRYKLEYSRLPQTFNPNLSHAKPLKREVE